MSLFLDVIIPAAGLVIILGDWLLVYYRGWAQLLPAFTRYLVFTAVSSTVFCVFYWSTFPLGMNGIAYQVYLYAYYLVWLLAIVLFLRFLFELLRITLPAHPEVRRGITAVLASFVVVFFLARVLLCLGCAACHFSGVERFSNAALRLQELTLIALLIRLLFIKRKFRMHWGRTLSLLVLGPVLAFSAEIVLSVVDFNYGRQTVGSRMAGQIVWLTWIVLWWIALQKSPEPASRAAAAPG